jgi:hypothetical protein
MLYVLIAPQASCRLFQLARVVQMGFPSGGGLEGGFQRAQKQGRGNYFVELEEDPALMPLSVP